MELSRVILGPVVTEKAERLKSADRHMYTLRVAPKATKIEVRKALEQYFDVQVLSIRALTVRPKTREVSPYQSMEKRHASRKVMVTLLKDSKPLDLSAFKVRA